MSFFLPLPFFFYSCTLLLPPFLPLTTHIPDPGCSNHPLRIERPSEGAYGYSAPQSTPRTPQCPGGCPMCYHSTKNPCQHCGCPSVRSGDQEVLVGNVRIGDQGATQRLLGGSLNLPVTRHRSALPTPDFFSPSSDYYSLSTSSTHSLSSSSPTDPPSTSSPATSSSPNSTTPSTEPIYAKVNKTKVSSPEKKVNKVESQENQEVNQEVNLKMMVEREAPLPLYLEKVLERRDGNRCNMGSRGGGGSRRHSWASPRGPNTLPPTKHTSLQVNTS